MPIYTYKCRRCGDTKDLKCGMGLAPSTMRCGECNIPMQRLYSPPNVAVPAPGKKQMKPISSKEVSTAELRRKNRRYLKGKR